MPSIFSPAQPTIGFEFTDSNDPDEVNNLVGQPEVAEVEQALRLRILERVMESQVYTGTSFGQ